MRTLTFTQIFALVGVSSAQTLEMVFLSTLFAFIMGYPLGILLASSDPLSGITPHPLLNRCLGGIVNIMRSFPFVILMVVIFPLTRLLVGTTIGTAATIVPLSIAAAPFVARVVESALKEVDSGMVQAARAMGSTNSQIIFKVLLPEALPAIVDGMTLTIINLIGYSAMAGTIGGGGLGDLAIRYGYQRYETRVLLLSVLVLIVMVIAIQWLGNFIRARIMAKR